MNKVMTVRDIGHVRDKATRPLNCRGVSMVSTYNYMVRTYRRVCKKVKYAGSQLCCTLIGSIGGVGYYLILNLFVHFLVSSNVNPVQRRSAIVKRKLHIQKGIMLGTNELGTLLGAYERQTVVVPIICHQI